MSAHPASLLQLGKCEKQEGSCLSTATARAAHAPHFPDSADYILPERLLHEGQEMKGAGDAKVLSGHLLTPDGKRSQVAIKVLKDASDAASAQEVACTIAMSRRAPHVVHCMGWSRWPTVYQLALVMKLYPHGTLRDLINDQVGDALPMATVLRLGLDIALGLTEVHSQGLLVEDLKPDNVLVDEGGSHAVLSDLGLSRHLGNQVLLSTRTAGGTLFYIAPEKLCSGLGGERYRSYFSDVWSYGVTMLQAVESNLFAPYGPGTTHQNIVNQLIFQKEPPCVPATPAAPGLQPLLQSCLSLDPGSRPTAPAIVKSLEEMMQALVPEEGRSDGASPDTQLPQSVDGPQSQLRGSEQDERGTAARLEHATRAAAAELQRLHPGGTSPNSNAQNTSSDSYIPLKPFRPEKEVQHLQLLGCGGAVSRTLSELEDLFAAVNEQRALHKHCGHCTFDLCGQTVSGKLSSNLCPPSNSSVVNGRIELPLKRQLHIGGGSYVCLAKLHITSHKGMCVVTICGSSTVRMTDCKVYGDMQNRDTFETIMVQDPGSKLVANRCSTHCSKTGVCVCTRGGLRCWRAANVTGTACPEYQGRDGQWRTSRVHWKPGTPVPAAMGGAIWL